LDEKTRAFDYANVSYQMALSNVDRANRTSGNVNSVVVVPVGGTRGGTWRIDRSIQRHAWITWGVLLILAIFFFIVFLYV
jgi:hypothetical protein